MSETLTACYCLPHVYSVSPRTPSSWFSSLPDFYSQTETPQVVTICLFAIQIILSSTIFYHQCTIIPAK